ncbi:hypothetical protein B0H13DRAFT_1893843 [Mycena leptocephala]|nr:hypothetical protein B0H13DRAFT_1893843 [Mycena leptocephala]
MAKSYTFWATCLGCAFAASAWHLPMSLTSRDSEPPFRLSTAGLVQSTQTAVTLWQLSGPRLLEGQVTAPLQPLGTASDGSATTYLYQVLNPLQVVTTDESGFVTNTVKSATPRTIIASASGWVELNVMHSISCGFVDSSFGCLDMNPVATKANSGQPTPVTIPISGVSTQTSLSLLPTPPTTLNPVPSTTETDDSGLTTRNPAIGTIVGGIVGALLLILGLILGLWWRRRRISRTTKELAPQPYSPRMGADENNTRAPHSGTPPSAYSYNDASQSELEKVTRSLFTASNYSSGPTRGFPNAQDQQHSKNVRRGAPSSGMGTPRIPSDVPTSELAWTLYHRMQDQDFNGAPPPPGYV